MLDKIKAFFKWVYNWITVIVGIVMGFMAIGLQIFDQLTGIDLTSFVTHQRAVQITTAVAVAKALVSTYNARKQS